MSGGANKTFGTKLKRGDVYVAKILNINPPEISRTDIDVTNHDSPDGYQEFIPGLKNGGEVPFTGHLLPTEEGHLGLAAAVDSEVPEPWTIEFPTDPVLKVDFDGYLKTFKVGDAPLDGALTFSASIKVTGKPTMSAGTGA
jgi:hypothetical protein